MTTAQTIFQPGQLAEIRQAVHIDNGEGWRPVTDSPQDMLRRARSAARAATIGLEPEDRAEVLSDVLLRAVGRCPNSERAPSFIGPRRRGLLAGYERDAVPTVKLPRHGDPRHSWRAYFNLAQNAREAIDAARRRDGCACDAGAAIEEGAATAVHASTASEARQVSPQMARMFADQAAWSLRQMQDGACDRGGYVHVWRWLYSRARGESTAVAARELDVQRSTLEKSEQRARELLRERYPEPAALLAGIFGSPVDRPTVNRYCGPLAGRMPACDWPAAVRAKYSPTVEPTRPGHLHDGEWREGTNAGRQPTKAKNKKHAEALADCRQTEPDAPELIAQRIAGALARVPSFTAEPPSTLAELRAQASLRLVRAQMRNFQTHNGTRDARHLRSHHAGT